MEVSPYIQREVDRLKREGRWPVKEVGQEAEKRAADRLAKALAPIFK